MAIFLNKFIFAIVFQVFLLHLPPWYPSVSHSNCTILCTCGPAFPPIPGTRSMLIPRQSLDRQIQSHHFSPHWSLQDLTLQDLLSNRLLFSCPSPLSYFQLQLAKNYSQGFHNCGYPAECTFFSFFLWMTAVQIWVYISLPLRLPHLK